MNPIFTDKPLTVEQAAEFTGFSKAYIYKLAHLKKIPYFKPEGGRVLFAPADLSAFVYRNRVAADYELRDRADGILNGGTK